MEAEYQKVTCCDEGFSKNHESLYPLHKVWKDNKSYQVVLSSRSPRVPSFSPKASSLLLIGAFLLKSLIRSR